MDCETHTWGHFNYWQVLALILYRLVNTALNFIKKSHAKCRMVTYCDKWCIYFANGLIYIYIYIYILLNLYGHFWLTTKFMIHGEQSPCLRRQQFLSRCMMRINQDPVTAIFSIVNVSRVWQDISQPKIAIVSRNYCWCGERRCKRTLFKLHNKTQVFQMSHKTANKNTVVFNNCM